MSSTVRTPAVIATGTRIVNGRLFKVTYLEPADPQALLSPLTEREFAAMTRDDEDPTSIHPADYVVDADPEPVVFDEDEDEDEAA